MLCQVFRSEKKRGAYLYLAHKKTLEDVPAELIQLLGQCVSVMHLDLSKRAKLASEDIEQVKANLTEQGYHLQMPPKDNVHVVNYGV